VLTFFVFLEKLKEANYGRNIRTSIKSLPVVMINVSPSMREIETIVLGIIFT
jgi:hypothetical protein